MEKSSGLHYSGNLRKDQLYLSRREGAWPSLKKGRARGTNIILSDPT